jgi:hypothetical protein
VTRILFNSMPVPMLEGLLLGLLVAFLMQRF